MKRIFYLLALIFLALACNQKKQPDTNSSLNEQILHNEGFAFVKKKAMEIVNTGFNAGDGYGEVWIRDYNTFIELSCEVYQASEITENLLVFFRMQGDDGNVIDGFIPKSKVSGVGYDYIYSELEPRYAGHKNTVETDQESSLVQAVYKYIKKTGDKAFLENKIGDKSVSDRLEDAMNFLMNHRYNETYGLIWGATTADWGDVQPEHDWGVYLTDDTHYSIDIYDNAMFLIAMDNLMELVPEKKKNGKQYMGRLQQMCVRICGMRKIKSTFHMYTLMDRPSRMISMKTKFIIMGAQPLPLKPDYFRSLR